MRAVSVSAPSWSQALPVQSPWWWAGLGFTSSHFSGVRPPPAATPSGTQVPMRVPTLTAVSLFPGLCAGHSCLAWSRDAQQCPARRNIPGTDI